jgi:hypothetical protein
MGVESEKRPRQKKPYIKPNVVKVQLTPEEVVLGACKSGGSGPGGILCRLCGGHIGS